MTKRISILGSTGSIGTQALAVCKGLSYQVTGLAAHSNIKLLAQQAKSFDVKTVCIYDETKYEELKALLSDIDVEILTGMDGLCRLSSMEEADIVLNAVVGMVGLRPTLSAIEAGKPIALANKETLVAGGELVMAHSVERKVPILPVDSEHSAIFQAMQGNDPKQVKKIILTASGGPFFGMDTTVLRGVTPRDALKHPNWDMGAKVTIDSATLMNKGLELIEACRLFDKRPEEIEIVIHRESVIHSLVEYADHSVMAQLGVPDMKLPIQYALTYPDRLPCDTGRLSLTEYGSLHFHKPDEETFITLEVCREAVRRGGLYPAWINGANEQAVALFLSGKIRFLDIGRLVQKALYIPHKTGKATLEDILEADRMAREFVRNAINR